GALHQLLQRARVRLLGDPRLVRGQERLESHLAAPSSLRRDLIGRLRRAYAAISFGTTTAPAAASSRECVIESSIRTSPSRSAQRAVRPLRWTPGFGRPRTSISFHVK